MKKGIIIILAVLALILLTLFIAPIVFKGPINYIIRTQANNRLNAKFDFKDLKISLFRNFPNASVSLRDVKISGINEFENDTLLAAGRLTAVVNLFSLISGNYQIVKIEIKDTYCHAIILANGKVNWDIVKSAEKVNTPAKTAEPPPKTKESPAKSAEAAPKSAGTAQPSAESAQFAVELKKFILDNVNVIFEDRSQKLYAEAKNINVSLSGNLGSKRTKIDMNAAIAAITFKMNNIAYLSNAKFGAKLNVDADLAAKKFTLLDNKISLNAITISLGGWLGMPASGGFDMDLKVLTNKINFKDILSMIPAVYANDFKKIKTTGDVEFDASAKGLFKDDNLPAFNAKLNIANASFRYSSMPRGIEEINILTNVANPGGSVDRTVLDINKFSFKVTENPFALSLHLKTPVSDPDFAFAAKGTIDLGHIKEVAPLDKGMTLSGLVKTDIDMAGRLSYIEKRQFDRFKSLGTIAITGLKLNMKKIPPVEILQSLLTFSPVYVQLSETKVTVGQSDVTTDCRFENYLGFVLKDTILKGNLNVNSNYLNINELIGGSSTETAASPAEKKKSASAPAAPAEKEKSPAASAEKEKKAAPATAANAEKGGNAPVAAFVVPKNIDFIMNTAVKRLTFDKIEATNILGKVIVKDGKIDLSNLSLNALEGVVVANGSYSTALNETTPDVNMLLKLDDVSFIKTFEAFPTVAEFAPVFKDIKGKYSGSVDLETALDATMNPVISTLTGNGFIVTRDVDLSSVEIINDIFGAAKMQKQKNLVVRDMRIDFTIKNGRLITKPFDIKLGETNINLSGSTGIDKTIDYSGKVAIPPSMGVASRAGVLPLKITGTFDNPSVAVDMKAVGQNVISNIAKEEAVGALSKVTGVDKAEIEAQRKAILENAQNAGDKLVEEAKKQAKELEKRASNPVAKAAAKVAGDKLVKEAQKKSDDMVAQAEKDGEKISE